MLSFTKILLCRHVGGQKTSPTNLPTIQGVLHDIRSAVADVAKRGNAAVLGGVCCVCFNDDVRAAWLL